MECRKLKARATGGRLWSVIDRVSPRPWIIGIGRRIYRKSLYVLQSACEITHQLSVVRPEVSLLLGLWIRADVNNSGGETNLD
jgi:hypothetical protein